MGRIMKLMDIFVAIRSHLVEDVHNFWKWWSMRAMGLATVITAAWIAIPNDLRSYVSPNEAKALIFILLVLGIAGRVVDQPGLKK